MYDCFKILIPMEAIWWNALRKLKQIQENIPLIKRTDIMAEMEKKEGRNFHKVSYSNHCPLRLPRKKRME